MIFYSLAGGRSLDGLVTGVQYLEAEANENQSLPQPCLSYNRAIHALQLLDRPSLGNWRTDKGKEFFSFPKLARFLYSRANTGERSRRQLADDKDHVTEAEEKKQLLLLG